MTAATRAGARASAAGPVLAAVFAISLLRVLSTASLADSAAQQTALLFNALSIGLWGTLATLLLWSQAQDQRARLFALTALGIVATIAFDTIPAPDVGSPAIHLYLIVGSAIFFFTPPVLMHMCGSIPSRNPLLERYRYFLPAAYITAALLFTVFTIASTNALNPFLSVQFDVASVFAARAKSVQIAHIVAGICGLSLLARAGLTEPLPMARRQAWLVFTGVAPWTVNVILMMSISGYAQSETGGIMAELTILLCALALFLSIAGYRLFEVNATLRRALVFGGALGLLIGAIAIAAQATISFTRDGVITTSWATVVVLLVGGMVAQPVVAAVVRRLDAQLFPERRALDGLRRELISLLASERTVDAMSKRLVDQLSLALRDAEVTLLLVDVSDHFFRGRASSREVKALPVIPADWMSQWQVDLNLGNLFDRERNRENAGLRNALDGCNTQFILPITLDRTSIGVVLIGDLNGWYLDQTERELLNDIARQTSAMLENVRLLDLATIDPLTRLARRHVAQERIVYELERSRRSNAPLSVAMIDIDFFKRVNDTYGHAMGDVVLREVADTLVSVSRRIDLVARWGGEEFLLVFPETDVEGAIAHAEALREAVGQLEIKFGDAVIGVTISAGVYEVIDEGAITLARTIAAVDQGLYEAKTTGRNRVVRSQPVAKATYLKITAT